jgi:hypothetical protein
VLHRSQGHPKRFACRDCQNGNRHGEVREFESGACPEQQRDSHKIEVTVLCLTRFHSQQCGFKHQRQCQKVYQVGTNLEKQMFG